MSAPADDAAHRVYVPHLIHNTSVINNIKFISSCFAGAVAGVLGLENWLGFALFIVSTLFTSACLYIINFEGRPKKYVQGGMMGVLNPGQENVFSFILVWTLFYGASLRRAHEIRVYRLQLALLRVRMGILVFRTRGEAAIQLYFDYPSARTALISPLFVGPMAASYVLLQIGDDPFHMSFEDLNGRVAFTIQEVDRSPNILVRLRREAPWALQHRDIMGPSDAFFYFGPSNMPGYIVYGNTPEQPMNTAVRRKRSASTSQSGKELKWKVSRFRMECIDGVTVLATYELNQVPTEHPAILTVKHAGLAVVTEIVTTLMLIRMAQALKCTMPPLPPTTLTKHLCSLSSTRPYASATQHPFLTSVGNGTLPAPRLALWLSQDRIYASQAYPRFIGRLISSIPSALTGVAEKEEHNQRVLGLLVYAFQKRWWKTRKATRDYVAEMARVAVEGTLFDGMVFLWAMEQVYLDAWRYVSSVLVSTAPKINVAVPSLVANWTNIEFVKFVENLASAVDAFDIRPGSDEWVRAEEIWARVVELEEAFWPEEGEESTMKM
ncbi:hypothetical protein EW146_g2592 [Bondarzewia mesenterica]|uniref:Uncharacterized protein n=1 Tax=Bondarzewia mesenterica TaxID=1095465 RepID=A0A4S4M099_9AGAM|nr:hypothetical protein EW146_g2592 [Bondarzewia mesenterica]